MVPKPKGLKLELWPTVGNHDQQFLDNWLSKRKEFSSILEGDIVWYCGKTIEKTRDDISTTETALRSMIERTQEIQAHRASYQNKWRSNQKQLAHQKLENFNMLRYKTQKTHGSITIQNQMNNYLNNLTQMP